MELINILVWVLIVGAAFYALMWVVDWMALPAPFSLFAKVIVGCIMLIIIVGFLTGYTPLPRLLPMR